MKKKKIGRPKRRKEIALDCYFRHKRRQTEVQIGLHYHWSIQRDNYNNPICITARRYIRDGKMYHEESIRIRNRAFGFKDSENRVEK